MLWHTMSIAFLFFVIFSVTIFDISAEASSSDIKNRTSVVINLCCPESKVLSNGVCSKKQQNSSINSSSSYNTSYPLVLNGSLIASENRSTTLSSAQEVENVEEKSQSICNVRSCPQSPCFRKCCNFDEILQEIVKNSSDLPQVACIKKESFHGNYSGNQHQLYRHATPKTKISEKEHNSMTIHYQFTDLPNCRYKYLKNDISTWFRMFDDGSVKIAVQLTYRPVWLPVLNESYCIDEIKQENAMSNNSELSQILVYCNVSNLELYKLQRKLYGWLNLLSALLLFVVLVINYLLWSTHKLSGWTIISLFTAMFFCYLCFGIDFLTNVNSLETKRTEYCFIKGLVIQFFFLANGSSWVIVNFDMFRTFKNLYQQTEIWTNRKRLICYLIFSWVCPAIIVVFGTMTQFIIFGKPQASKAFHEFAFMSCYSPIVRPAMYYQLVLAVLNVGLFLSTSVLICKHRTSVRATLNNCALGESLTLFLKLSVLSGVYFIPLAILDVLFSGTLSINWFWFVFRANHFISDLFIFRAFGISHKNILALRRKYPRFNSFMRFSMPWKKKTSISNHSLGVINPSRGSQSTCTQ